jgi:acetolactate synthase-1/2/3 large subunit
MEISGAEALMRSLIEEGVDTIFGYPGGQIMAVYDKLYDYSDRLKHILVRHEQGAIHAAQGFARIKGRPGVVIVTSGPGATNVITGVTDAMTDSTPVIVITGQVSSAALGTDAFQEADVIGLTSPITKWNYQIRRAQDVPWAIARAFYIATTGRPGPVVLDFTKDAQNGMAEFIYHKCHFIRSYVPEKELDESIILSGFDTGA